jgi:truncated hemoglobin YjbI
MKDIENRQDIETLMAAFYSKALTDEMIGYFFHRSRAAANGDPYAPDR